MEFAIFCCMRTAWQIPTYDPETLGREGTPLIRGGELSENVKTELGQKRHHGACNGYTVKVSFHVVGATKSSPHCATLKLLLTLINFPAIAH